MAPRTSEEDRFLNGQPTIHRIRGVPRLLSGPKSVRHSMQYLDHSARRIADAHLHVHIRQRTSLPSPTQVNLANDIDALLAEIIRIAS